MSLDFQCLCSRQHEEQEQDSGHVVTSSNSNALLNFPNLFVNFQVNNLTQQSKHKDSMATSNFANSFHGHCMAPFLPGEWLLEVKIVQHKTHNAMMFYLFSPQLDIGPAPLCVCASSSNIHPKACGTCVDGARFA